MATKVQRAVTILQNIAGQETDAATLRKYARGLASNYPVQGADGEAVDPQTLSDDTLAAVVIAVLRRFMIENLKAAEAKAAAEAARLAAIDQVEAGASDIGTD